MNAQPITARRRRRVGTRGAIGIAVAATLMTSACAAGQLAQTSNQRSSIDGVNASVGHMDLRALALQAPGGAPFYPVGSTVAFKVVIVNSGHTDDQLVGIKTSVAKDWTSSGGSSTKRVTVPAGNRVGYGVPSSKRNLALLSTTQTLYPSATVPITFTFAKAGSIRVAVPVQLRPDAGDNASLPAPKDAVGD